MTKKTIKTKNRLRQRQDMLYLWRFWWQRVTLGNNRRYRLHGEGAQTRTKGGRIANVGAIIGKNATDWECPEAAKHVEHQKSQYQLDGDGILIWQSSIDGALQKLVPTLLHAWIMYLTQYPRLAVPPQEGWMYYTMPQHFWPQMENDIPRESKNVDYVREMLQKHGIRGKYSCSHRQECESL